MSYTGLEPRLTNVTYTPQSADPAAPFEGMVYRSNGTPRAAGLWQYISGAWQPISPSIAYSNDTNLVSAGSDITFSAGWGTLSENFLFVQQQGQHLIVAGQIRIGSVGASVASIGLPAKWTMNTSVLSTSGQQVGNAWRAVTGSMANSVNIFYDGSDASNLYFCLSGAGNLWVKQNVSTNFATNDRVTFNIRIPVSGFTAVTPYSAFDSNSATMTFKSTALTSGDSIGTYNFYTKTANSNTLTLSTSAPTQSSASMNTNGIFMRAIRYDQATTLGDPSRIAIRVGTGLRDISLFGYTALGKLNAVDVGFSFAGTANNSATGIIRSYDPVNGILYLDCQTDPSGTVLTTQRDIGIRNDSTTTTLAGATAYIHVYVS